MASESASASSTPTPEPAGPAAEPSPAAAARALAELRTRQTQVLAERRRSDPRWVSLATTTLAVAGVAVREAGEDWRHRRNARIAIGAASAAAGLPWGGTARADLWLGSPAPTAALSPAASTSLSPAASSSPASSDDVDWTGPDYAPMRGVLRATGRSISSTLAVTALGRVAIGRLRARGVPRLWIADCALIVLSRLLGAHNSRRTEAALQQAARDVGTAAIDGVETPALAPQLADPTAFSLVALLLPASAVREDLLAEALPLDRVVLADRLAALARAGLIEPNRRGRLRPRPWWTLTDRGRELATAHVAALRRRVR